MGASVPYSVEDEETNPEGQGDEAPQEGVARPVLGYEQYAEDGAHAAEEKAREEAEGVQLDGEGLEGASVDEEHLLLVVPEKIEENDNGAHHDPDYGDHRDDDLGCDRRKGHVRASRLVFIA